MRQQPGRFAVADQNVRAHRVLNCWYQRSQTTLTALSFQCSGTEANACSVRQRNLMWVMKRLELDAYIEGVSLPNVMGCTARAASVCISATARRSLVRQSLGLRDGALVVAVSMLIGTRKSTMALAQTEDIARHLSMAAPELNVEIVKFETTVIPTRPASYWFTAARAAHSSPKSALP